jgi:GntR family transcriptional regulator
MALDKQTSADEISPLRFLLDARSGVPTYLQLVQQVEQALRLGILREGDQLPRVKDAVTALAINPNTVLKAYRELALRGLATTRPGVGTFVHESLPVIDLAGQATLRRALVKWVHSAQEAGLDHDAISALVSNVLHEQAAAVPGRKPTDVGAESV